MKKTSLFSLFFLAVFAFLSLVSAVFGQTETSSLIAQTQTDTRKAELQANLDELEKEIAAQNLLLQGKQKERVSIERDVVILEAQIKKAKLLIQARDITLGKLGGDINKKTTTIDDLSQKIGREKESLSQLLRKTDEVDQSSVVEMVLSKQNLSDFFLDIDSFTSIKGALRDSLFVIAEAKTQTEEEKAALEESRRKEADAKAELEAERRTVQKNEKEKNQLLSITKNKEKEYKKVLDERKKRAAEIRSALFELRDSGGIQFGQAYEYAVAASQKTGVRPAFLLAILTQETNLGKVQGSCYLKNQDGSGVNVRNISYSKVMKPSNVPDFLAIVGNLGGDPYNTAVSCPYWNKAKQREEGWGGAMGPAQFLPSTWVLYSAKVASFLGKSVADPWNPKDAFMGSALLLQDNGAANGGYSAEYDAAWKYFSGGKATLAKINTYGDYGKSVISIATKIQETQIDNL